MTDDNLTCPNCKNVRWSCTCIGDVQKMIHTTTFGPSISNQPITEGMKFDTGKLQYSLIPPETLSALASVLTYGVQKYAPNNWQLVEHGETRYMDALFRHLEAFRAGETHDPESGLHHLSHVLTNVAFLHYLHTTNKD